MSITTSWVKSAPSVTGQDHLGTQAPCVSIYTEQLPGITNVTARARYYSFYPWFLREFEKRVPSATADDLVMYIRRAECLFALIAIRHGRGTDNGESTHGAAMVGREVLVPAIDGEHGSTLRLSMFADLAPSKQRYFLNPLGGLGQYYLGALREIGILGGDTRTRDVRYTEERGLRLAEAFGAAAEAEAFFDLVQGDEVELSDLDDLASFCPCALAGSDSERVQLTRLLVDPASDLGEESATRRATLALLLDLAAQPQEALYDFSDEFRASTYCGALLDGSTWTVPSGLQDSLRAWRAYEMNELLSVAFQGLFWSALQQAIDEGVTRFADADAFAMFATKRLFDAAFGAAPEAKTWKAHVQAFASSLPAPSSWTDDNHEVQAGWEVVRNGRSGDISTTVTRSSHILAALAARGGERDPYLDLHFTADYFERYPINLRSFARRSRGEWAHLSLEAVLRAWLMWTVRTHWRVALQKLAEATPRDTFKIRQLDGAVRIIDAPAPMFTAPRVHRAIAILRDLGLLADDESGRVTTTHAGRQVLEQLRG
jgi:hypothetical protein